MKTTFTPGKWLSICDVCGFRFYNTELRKDWRGLMVDDACFETRHPQDFLRVPTDNPAVPWTRPEPPDVFQTFCIYPTYFGEADIGTADCARAGLDAPDVLVCISGTSIAGEAIAGCAVTGS